ncbi:MAG: hypothetical protein ACRERD_16130 [Candidatus Binatia bacterium]
MPISPEKQKRFEHMQRELDDLNEAWGRGDKRPLLKYDQEEFMAFRGWQAEKLEERFQKEHLPLIEARYARKRAARNQ